MATKRGHMEKGVNLLNKHFPDLFHQKIHTLVHLAQFCCYFQHLAKKTKKQKIFFWLHVTITVNCQLSECSLHLRVSLSCHFCPPDFLRTTQNVAQTKHQHFWKGSNSVNMVLWNNSLLGTGFRT